MARGKGVVLETYAVLEEVPPYTIPIATCCDCGQGLEQGCAAALVGPPKADESRDYVVLCEECFAKIYRFETRSRQGGGGAPGHSA